MPVNIMVGLVALLVALVCYSVGAWWAFRAKSFGTTQLTLVWVGFVFDVVATVMMGVQIGGLDLRPGTPLVHTVLALVAMAGMLGAAVAGTWALRSRSEAVSLSVSRLVLAPWAIWVFVFVWGMVERGAARMR
jgi:hypothetical protein